MRLRDAVLKESHGRTWLHHLRSSYNVELNQKALSAIEAALVSPATAGETALGLVDRLAAHGLVEEGEARPIPRRNGSDLVSIEVEPIGRCNLFCEHCFVSFSHAVMSEQLFGRVLEGARALGAVELSFNGGEPLMHPRLLDWIERARAAGLRVVLFTNATLLAADGAARLRAAGLAKAIVSLDGFEAEHDALRGAGAFAGAVAGIRLLVAAGIPTWVTALVHPAGAERHEAFARWCREELGVRGIRKSTVAPLGRAAQKPGLQLDEAAFRAVYDESEASRPAPPAPEGSGFLPCSAAVNKLFVSAAGGVYGCHLFEQARDRLGDLHQATLAQIHGAIAGVPSGVLYRAFDPARLPDCRACEAFARCRGGCRARAWLLTGDPHGPDLVSCRKMGVAQRR